MLRLLRPLLLMLMLAAFARPVLCQDAGLKPLLSGSSVPLTMKLGGLNGDWRRMSVGQLADINSVTRFYTTFLGGGPGDVYYTKGDTVMVGPDQYLVAYHAPTAKIDLQALFKLGTPHLPKSLRLTADTVLNLSLLNLHTVSSLADIRTFDLQQEIADSDSSGLLGEMGGVTQTVQNNSVEASSDSNLKQIGLAIEQYVQDYDEVLPPMTSAAVVKKAIYLYVKNDEVFISPINQQPYLPNTSLSHRTLASFESPSEMVIYYEATPAPDNTRGLLFFDGHVKRVPEADWPRYKSLSHIPNTPVPASLPPGVG